MQRTLVQSFEPFFEQVILNNNIFQHHLPFIYLESLGLWKKI